MNLLPEDDVLRAVVLVAIVAGVTIVLTVGLVNSNETNRIRTYIEAGYIEKLNDPDYPSRGSTWVKPK